MPSIRRSLTVYLLALCAVALGGVCVLVDRTVSDTLSDRLAVAEARVQEQYEDKCHAHRAKVDEGLLTRARLIGHAMQAEAVSQFDQEFRRFAVVTDLVGYSAALTPLPSAVWFRMVHDNRWAPVPGRLARAYYSNLTLSPDFTAQIEKQSDDDKHPYFYQINSPFGTAWRSAGLAGQTIPLAIGEYDTARMAMWDSRTESAAIQPGGQRVRLVVLKTPILTGDRLSFRGRPPSPPPAARGGPRPAPPPPPPAPQPEQVIEATPRLYVLVARPVLPDEEEFADAIEWRNGELEVRQAEYRQARVRLRAYLLGIAGAGFLAVAVGGPLLVRRGLKPVRRLSDAVGRVTERDFRLPVGAADLSEELLPIHARLSVTLEQLRAAFEREKQAVADISHELRTPVAALLTTLDVSLRKPRSADQYRQTMEECRAITRQLGQLVERVMTLAYLDAGQAKVSRTPTDAGELAAGCAAVIRPLAAAHGLSFTVKPADGVTVETDPDKLREVLMNLLHNAVEYNRPGGAIELGVRAAGGRAVFEVRDTGIGMTDEVRGRIFERFYRADPSRTQTGVHAGLGLAIVKEYVERLGGTITVESDPGAGSTFRVELPASAA
jgi:signal transduction histidine kinase